MFLRQGKGWVLGPHPFLEGLRIRDGLVEKQVLDHLRAITLDGLVTVEADEDYREERHLTEATGLVISCARNQNERPLAHAFKGRRAEELAKDQGAVHGYYICRTDKPKEVIVYDPSDAWQPILDASEWVDRVIHDILIGDMRTLAVKNPKLAFTIRKKKGTTATWVAVKGKVPKDVGPLQQTFIPAMLEQFRKVEAHKFEGRTRAIDQKQGLDSLGLAPTKSRFEITATLKNGEVYWLRIGNRVPGELMHYAVASNTDYVFTLRASDVNVASNHLFLLSTWLFMWSFSLLSFI